MATIKLKRGLHANLPTTGMAEGEPLATTDRGNLHLVKDATTRISLTPAIDLLTTIPSVAGAADLLIVHDASESAGQKEKKITFDAFKTALNLPAGSSDELVAVVAGGTSGYLWGTDGNDGVIRMGASMSWTKDAGDGFVTINVASVDGGSF